MTWDWRLWDFVHCPAWTEHVFVGAGEGPCAQRETSDPSQAYAEIPDDVEISYRDGWLPG